MSSPARKKLKAPKTVAAPVELAEDFLDDALTPKQIRFVQEFCVDFNQTQAARRAGYSEHTASAIGHENLKKPSVLEAVRRRMSDLAAEAEVTSTRVIAELATLAFSDPRELCRVEVSCCNHCHGTDHNWQWSEPVYKAAFNKAMVAQQPLPDAAGGFGYNPNRDPHPECPACFGRGISTVVVTPSNKLSRGAARLMASVKQDSKGAIELKTHDQQAALMALAKVTGCLVDRSSVEIQNAEGFDIEALMKKDPKSMSQVELELAYRLTQKQLAGKTIDAKR